MLDTRTALKPPSSFKRYGNIRRRQTQIHEQLTAHWRGVRPGADTASDGGPSPSAFTAHTRNPLSEVASNSSTDETERSRIGVELILIHDNSMNLST